MATENQKKRKVKPEDEPVTRSDHYGDSEPTTLGEDPSSNNDTISVKGDHYGDSEPVN